MELLILIYAIFWVVGVLNEKAGWAPLTWDEIDEMDEMSKYLEKIGEDYGPSIETHYFDELF